MLNNIPEWVKGYGFHMLIVCAIVGSVYAGAWFIGTLSDRLDRQHEATQEYNCKHYGTAINKHAGSDVCAPTPKG